MDRYLRQFKKGILELVVLKMLSSREMYGYELISALGACSNYFVLKEGTLYPILYRLEDEGLMATRWEQQATGRGVPKKYYSITVKGKETMTAAVETWKLFSSDVAKILN